MSDLISRSALSEQLKQYKSEWKLAEPFHEGIASGLKIAIEVTDRQPTVEAREVVHGCWEYHWFDSICSVCGYTNKADGVTRIRNDYKFCPNCGADMRKVE